MLEPETQSQPQPQPSGPEDAVFKAMLDEVPVGVYRIDRAGCLTYANLPLLKMLGIAVDGALGRVIYDFFPESVAANQRKDDQWVMATGQSTSQTPATGERQYRRETKSAIRNAQGVITGLQAFFWDATDLMLAHADLKESEVRFNLFMDKLPAAAFMKDEDSTAIYCNRYMQDIIGAKTWMGKDVHSLFPKELAEKMIADDRRSLQAGYTVLEEDVPCTDGKTRAYQTHKFAIPRAGMAPLLGAIAIDISERKQNEAELLAAKQAAEAASLSKSRFFAAASHDLRQPIHAQGLFLDILSRSGLNPHQQQSLDCAIAASQASAEMLNTMLDFSRIEAGVVQPQVVSFRLQPLLNKIEREFARQADVKGLAYRSRETALAADSDPALIELILRNLVSNAIRYTDGGGLLVACRQRDDRVLLEVWDTGIGIESAHQREVFREFHQLGNPERDRRKGLGLGLSIVEGLARTLQHPLLLVSKPGRGSMFRLSLPRGTGVCVDSAEVLTQHKDQLRDVRVLVVDDDEAVRIGTLQLLRDWGCVAEAAESIEEALVLAEKHVPDVVISDYRLRDQHTGLEAIAALRSVLGQGLPALLITGDTAPDRLREALSSNIPLLHKPVSPDQLHNGLVTVLLK